MGPQISTLSPNSSCLCLKYCVWGGSTVFIRKENPLFQKGPTLSSREKVRLVPKQIRGRQTQAWDPDLLHVYGKIISGHHLYARNCARPRESVLNQPQTLLSCSFCSTREAAGSRSSHK